MSAIEPYGYAFQHEETGLEQVVDIQQVEWGFEKNNPRWKKIGLVYPEAALAAKDAEIERLKAENDRLTRNNEMWKGQVERQAHELERLRIAITEALKALEGEPEYHDQGMGCGLEDRGITDRYEAMSHGWECAMERVYGENIAWAKDTLNSVLERLPASSTTGDAA